MNQQEVLYKHQQALAVCERCPKMQGPAVMGTPVLSKVLLIGQAPGPKEVVLKKPFAWTAGKTMFKWFHSIGLEEFSFRELVHMAAVCRCFPGKNVKGGDRVPDSTEIENCSSWLKAELECILPELVIPVGKLAISQLVEVNRLQEVVGHQYHLDVDGLRTDVIPLPHPSGASTWHRTEPGISLLKIALSLIQSHRTWQALIPQRSE